MVGLKGVRGAAAAAVGSLAIAMLVAAVPAHGAPGVPAAATGTTPTATPPMTPSPTPSPTETPTPTATGPTDDRLLPDLIALPASRPIVQVRSDGLRLRFDSSLGNIGAGPIEVRPNRNKPCPVGQHNSSQIIFRDGNGNGRFDPSRDDGITREQAGCMVYHPLHNHWHFNASARYTLLDPSQGDRVVVSARRKVSFCLRDTDRVPARFGEFGYSEAYGACSKRSPQGISVGWMDIYQRFLAGQSLPLPRRLKDGLYCLETVVDPLDQLVEFNDDNNSSIRALFFRGNRVALRDNQRCR